jgi:hypothetical protein
MALLKNTSINDTGFLKLPNGTTAQRPVSPSTGMIRYNTDLSLLEYWNGAEWKTCEDSLLDGSSAEKAAPSALYLINFAGKFENGYYWILVGGVPKLVYCESFYWWMDVFNSSI